MHLQFTRKLFNIIFLFVSADSERYGPVVLDIFSPNFFNSMGTGFGGIGFGGIGMGSMGGIGIGSIGGMGGTGGPALGGPTNVLITPAITECRELSKLWTKLLETFEDTFSRLSKMK